MEKRGLEALHVMVRAIYDELLYSDFAAPQTTHRSGEVKSSKTCATRDHVLNGAPTTPSGPLRGIDLGSLIGPQPSSALSLGIWDLAQGVKEWYRGLGLGSALSLEPEGILLQ